MLKLKPALKELADDIIFEMYNWSGIPNTPTRYFLAAIAGLSSEYESGVGDSEIFAFTGIPTIGYREMNLLVDWFNRFEGAYESYMDADVLLNYILNGEQDDETNSRN